MWRRCKKVHELNLYALRFPPFKLISIYDLRSSLTVAQTIFAKHLFLTALFTAAGFVSSSQVYAYPPLSAAA